MKWRKKTRNGGLLKSWWMWQKEWMNSLVCVVVLLLQCCSLRSIVCWLWKEEWRIKRENKKRVEGSRRSERERNLVLTEWLNNIEIDDDKTGPRKEEKSGDYGADALKGLARFLIPGPGCQGVCLCLRCRKKNVTTIDVIGSVSLRPAAWLHSKRGMIDCVGCERDRGELKRRGRRTEERDNEVWVCECTCCANEWKVNWIQWVI